MSIYTRRLQTVLTEDQFEALSKIAAEMEKPISVLIREAIEKTYLEPSRRDRRRAAAKRLISMNVPIGDWEQVEDEIARGMLQ